MPTQVGEMVLERRTHYRRALRTIMQTICRLETENIDQHDAEKAGIQQRSMSLESSFDKPYFFIPYEDEYHPTEREYSTYVPDVEDRLNCEGFHLYMDSCISQVYPEDDNRPFGVGYKAWPDLNLGELAEYSKYYWTASFTGFALPTHEPLPHMKCLIHSEATGDNRLLRGELIAIVKIMTARLNTKSLRPHTVAPVLLYSIMGPQQIRVLEAYFDGKNLIIRKTKLYDMKQEDMETVDLLTRWWLGFAVGETKSIKTAPLP
ncbi:hypothetical protein BDV32DRAFT_126626 [Aspergillus pseudonomiae]|uniref:Uncharacterized protein n=1 Tax=Aspergillus pseudonomiae TaxID=1506151 RepID=A0A5N6HVL5_9EURO|nr:uncharacterized protein BDV37DRAFT_239940 [Aspergillus pseudonomiae]KAB8257904.1 hypothetical protein BDV32DRAFT_126626 [Aspergillus pseudonomiae]KAE8408107.1 hypothetical protein BDV37DRAFT_239940 [Aspergillus pseudonomiae]